MRGAVAIPGKCNSRRNKLFFLFSKEWRRYRIAQTALATVPDQLFRQGNFSELLSANNFFNRTYSLKDASGNPIPGNIIPQSQLSKNGLALINAYPLPTAGFQQGTNNYIVSSPEVDNERKDTASVDYSPGDKHPIRGTFLNTLYDNRNPCQA